MFIIFDLDGTLALNKHREHYISGENKDWDAFFEACDKDEPNWPIMHTLSALSRDTYDIEIWSGRSDAVQEKTKNWLAKYKLAYVNLRMRKEGDYTPDEQLKKRWLDETIAEGKKPDLVFDDRDKVVKMWRENGITCCQVAEGSF